MHRTHVILEGLMNMKNHQIYEVKNDFLNCDICCTRKNNTILKR